jgi:hypothetical protein
LQKPGQKPVIITQPEKPVLDARNNEESSFKQKGQPSGNLLDDDFLDFGQSGSPPAPTATQNQKPIQ